MWRRILFVVGTMIVLCTGCAGSEMASRMATADPAIGSDGDAGVLFGDQTGERDRGIPIEDDVAPPSENKRPATPERKASAIKPVEFTKKSGDLGSCIVGERCERVIRAKGGSSNYRWTLIRGDLPLGFELGDTSARTVKIRANGRNGMIAGLYTFTLRVEDTADATRSAAQKLTLQIVEREDDEDVASPPPAETTPAPESPQLSPTAAKPHLGETRIVGTLTEYNAPSTELRCNDEDKHADGVITGFRYGHDGIHLDCAGIDKLDTTWQIAGYGADIGLTPYGDDDEDVVKIATGIHGGVSTRDAAGIFYVASFGFYYSALVNNRLGSPVHKEAAVLVDSHQSHVFRKECPSGTALTGIRFKDRAIYLECREVIFEKGHDSQHKAIVLGTESKRQIGIDYNADDVSFNCRDDSDHPNDAIIGFNVVMGGIQMSCGGLSGEGIDYEGGIGIGSPYEARIDEPRGGTPTLVSMHRLDVGQVAVGVKGRANGSLLSFGLIAGEFNPFAKGSSILTDISPQDDPVSLVSVSGDDFKKECPKNKVLTGIQFQHNQLTLRCAPVIRK